MKEISLFSMPLVPTINNISEQKLKLYYQHLNLTKNIAYRANIIAIHNHGANEVAENVLFGKSMTTEL